MINRSYNLILAFLLVFSFSNCRDKETNDSNTNPNKPGGNGYIINEKEFGSIPGKSEIKDLIEKGDGNYFYTAIKNSVYVVGEITSSGTVLWEKEPGFKVNGVLRIERFSGTLANALLVVGNSQSGSPTGRIAVYKSDGVFLSDLTLNDYSEVVLNSVSETTVDINGLIQSFKTHSVIVPDSVIAYNLFFAVGSAGSSGNVSPYSTYFVMNNEGKLSIEIVLPGYATAPLRSKFYNNFPNTYFYQIATKYFKESNTTANPEVFCQNAFPYYNFTNHPPAYIIQDYVNSNCDFVHSKFIAGYIKNSAGEIVDYVTFKMFEEYSLSYKTAQSSDASKANLTSLKIKYTGVDVSWNKKMSVITGGTATGLITGLGNILVSTAGSIYIVGTKEVNPMKPFGFYDAGFAYSLSVNGSLRWQKTINFTQFSERFEDSYSDGDYLYVGGTYSYIEKEDGRAYGNALLCKMNLSNGETIVNRDFGNAAYASSFNTILGSGNSKIVGAGFNKKSYATDTASQKGWYTELSKTSME